MDEHVIASGDGRDLEVLTGGDPGGFPFLFHLGTPGAAVPSALIDHQAREAGLRLITYSRPGYGASTPRPWPYPRIADDLADSVRVLDTLDVDGFVTLGWSGGGPRALACAALLPRRCRAAATLAGVGPADAPDLDFTAGMGPASIAEFAAAGVGVKAYDTFIAEQVPGLAAMTGAALAAQSAADPGGELAAVDVAAIEGEFAEWLASSLRHSVAQGTIGWREDGLAILAPWAFDLAETRVPVAIWQGHQDLMVPSAHGEWLAANVPGARAHLVEDEGHLSLVGRLPEILADLRALAGLDA